jgi:hypothetical protein
MGSAYDSVRQRVLVYGGQGAVAARAGLWQWDGSAWTAATEGTMTPGARVWPAMAFDDARGELVLFGGQDDEVATTYYGDTWTWNGMAWTKRTPPRSPSERGRVSMAFDAKRERLVLAGGFASGIPAARNDVWEWNGKTWIRSVDYPDPNGAGPPQYNAALVYDTERKVMVFVDIGNSRTYEYTVVGNACTTGADCASGFCVDRVCCKTSSCGTCEACNQLANPGTCTPVRDAPDPDSCVPPKRCNAAGMCPP